MLAQFKLEVHASVVCRFPPRRAQLVSLNAAALTWSDRF